MTPARGLMGRSRGQWTAVLGKQYCGISCNMLIASPEPCDKRYLTERIALGESQKDSFLALLQRWISWSPSQSSQMY
jgi:hypothetical protein